MCSSLIQEKFVIHFIILTIFFSVGDTAALGPQDFCNEYKPNMPGSSFVKTEPGIEPSNFTNSHYYGGPGQTSASIYRSNEKPMYKFILTKAEEEEEEKMKNMKNKRMYGL